MKLFLHCRKCTEKGKYRGNNVALVQDGLMISCRECDANIIYITQERLKTMLRFPQCEMCRQGMPHEH
jgi:hypothetical protein